MLNKAYHYFIPKDPQITTVLDENGNILKYCVDKDTEVVLQRQRLVAMGIGTPLIMYATFSKKMNKSTRTLLGLMGIACFITHAKAYNLIVKNS